MDKDLRKEAEDLIIRIINEKQGCKGTDLAFMLANNPVTRSFSHEAIDLLNELVSSGRLVEVEYVLPNMSYRIKSFYLPAGTEIRVMK